jgi:hypothetical protein
MNVHIKRILSTVLDHLAALHNWYKTNIVDTTKSMCVTIDTFSIFD